MSGPTCPDCQTIHGSDAVVAVGKFDPAGVHGYRARPSGPLRDTRADAAGDVCAARRPSPARCECGLTDPEMPCIGCRFSTADALYRPDTTTTDRSDR